MRRDAEQAAADIVSRTREEAAGELATMVEDAKRKSADLLARSRAEADRLTGEAERRRRELHAEITMLSDQRDSAMAELARLRSGLEALFSVPSAEDEGRRRTIDLRSVEHETTGAHRTTDDTEATAMLESPEDALRAESG